MDRPLIYPFQQPAETDLLNLAKNDYLALSQLAQVVLGTGPVLIGLPCTPGAGLTVSVGAGQVYMSETVDTAAYSSLPADSRTVVKQGVLWSPVVLNTPAPSVVGQSINYLVQVGFASVDTGSTVLSFYNATNPASPYLGPSNSGTPSMTVRSDTCVVQIKPGAAAATGSQVTPTPDAGFVVAYVITIATGQSSTNAGNIAVASGAPFCAMTLPLVSNNSFAVPIDSVQNLPASNPATVTLGGLSFLKTGTLGAAATYPLARVTSKFNFNRLCNGNGLGTTYLYGGLFKIGTKYIGGAGVGNGVFTASSLAGPWVQSGSVKGLVIQNASGLVAVNGAASNYTTDGVSYAPGTLTTDTWTDGAASPSMFMVLNGNGLAGGSTSYRTSPDGVNWTSRTLPAFSFAGVVAYGNGYFLYITGSGGSITDTSLIAYTSTDGINWTGRGTLFAHANVNGFPVITLDYVGGKFFLSFAYASGQPAQVWWSSTDGYTTWTACTGLPTTTAGTVVKQGTAFNGGVYINGSNFMTSTDGVTFTYPGVAGWANTPGPFYQITTIDNAFVFPREVGGIAGGIGEIWDTQYSAAGYVGLPYVMPPPTVPTVGIGPQDAYNSYVRVA